MSSKIDIREIVVDHYRTLRSFQSTRISSIDVIVFVGIPICSSVGLYFLCTSFFFRKVDLLVPFLGIVLGLLLNFQVLVFSARSKVPDDDKNLKLAKAIEELFYNISYCSLASLVLVLFVFFGLAFNLEKNIYFSVVLLGFLLCF